MSKPEPAVSYERKYKNVILNDTERKSLKVAADAGLKLYGITVYVQKECLLKAARAFLVFKAVEEMGQILVYSPSSHDIEDERFEFDFSFYLASDAGLEKVLAAITNVSEIENAVGEEIVYADVEAHSEKDGGSVVSGSQTAQKQILPQAREASSLPQRGKRQISRLPTGRSVWILKN